MWSTCIEWHLPLLSHRDPSVVMEDPEHVPNARPKRILVIGGGASGLVTLRNLRERGAFDDVQLVERRDDVGGVW